MEKVGKMVFKMKPSKSGINKLPLFRQFRPACKKLGSSDETFWRTWKFSAKRYMYIFYSTSAREGPLPLPNCFFCYTRPSSTLKVTWLIFFFGIFWNQNNKVMRQYHGLKQRRRTRRIHISLAPFGRKCQCSINFATWKNF